MKSRILISVRILFVILLAGCRDNNSPVPLKFTAYEHNPILIPGEPGAWDDLFLWIPQVVHYDSVFYLFYLGGNVSGRMAVGLAISKDGLHFIKHNNNPVLAPDEEGFGSYTVGPGIVLQRDSAWWMYYNAQNIAAFAPGRAVGRAIATSLTGPWVKDKMPVISSGSKGEWDAGFIIPTSVLTLSDGTLMMFYSGGEDIAFFNNFYLGMATSPDGIIWTKYNDPLTTQHPFAGSDPVLMTGNKGEWDGAFIWMANVTVGKNGFRMYYSGSSSNQRTGMKSMGYAESRDGIHWEKYDGNPVYSIEKKTEPVNHDDVAFMENPALIYLDTICFMYYEYGDSQVETSRIGMAKAILNKGEGSVK